MQLDQKALEAAGHAVTANWGATDLYIAGVAITAYLSALPSSSPTEAEVEAAWQAWDANAGYSKPERIRAALLAALSAPRIQAETKGEVDAHELRSQDCGERAPVGNSFRLKGNATIAQRSVGSRESGSLADVIATSQREDGASPTRRDPVAWVNPTYLFQVQKDGRTENCTLWDKPYADYHVPLYAPPLASPPVAAVPTEPVAWPADDNDLAQMCEDFHPSSVAFANDPDEFCHLIEFTPEQLRGFVAAHPPHHLAASVPDIIEECAKVAETCTVKDDWVPEIVAAIRALKDDSKAGE